MKLKDVLRVSSKVANIRRRDSYLAELAKYEQELEQYQEFHLDALHTYLQDLRDLNNKAFRDMFTEEQLEDFVAQSNATVEELTDHIQWLYSQITYVKSRIMMIEDYLGIKHSVMY